MKTEYILQYIVFGNQRFFDEARFSILSAFHFLNKEPSNCKIVIYTDNEVEFEDLDVETVNLSKNEWDSWAGEDNYVYRGKILCIKKCIDKYGLPIIFLDTDTYFKKHPKFLFERLLAGNNIMHFNEGIPNRDLLNYLNLPKIRNWLLVNGIKFPTGNNWNSGVIGIKQESTYLMNKILEFNDIYYKVSKYFATEQFAFSVILENTKLEATNDIVYHYWHESLKTSFIIQYERMCIDLKNADSNKWSKVYDQYLPFMPFKTRISLKSKIVLYRIGLYKKFRCLIPFFFKN